MLVSFCFTHLTYQKFIANETCNLMRQTYMNMSCVWRDTKKKVFCSHFKYFHGGYLFECHFSFGIYSIAIHFIKCGPSQKQNNDLNCQSFQSFGLIFVLFFSFHGDWWISSIATNGRSITTDFLFLFETQRKWNNRLNELWPFVKEWYGIGLRSHIKLFQK